MSFGFTVKFEGSQEALEEFKRQLEPKPTAVFYITEREIYTEEEFKSWLDAELEPEAKEVALEDMEEEELGPYEPEDTDEGKPVKYAWPYVWVFPDDLERVEHLK